MNRFFVFLFSSLVAGPALFAADSIQVRNKAGNAMEVEVMAYTASSGNVRIKRVPDGQIFNVKLDLFDPESQKAIKEAAPVAKPDLRVDVSVGRRRAPEGDSSYMKRQQITVTVKIENESRDIDLEESKFTIILLGRNMERYKDDDLDNARVFSKETFKRGIPAGRDLEYECKPVITAYDSDRDSSNIGGYEYDGYLLLLQNAKGEIVDAYSNVGPIEVLTLKDPELLKKALDLKLQAIVQRNLLPLGKTAVLR